MVFFHKMINSDYSQSGWRHAVGSGRRPLATGGAHLRLMTQARAHPDRKRDGAEGKAGVRAHRPAAAARTHQPHQQLLLLLARRLKTNRGGLSGSRALILRPFPSFIPRPQTFLTAGPIMAPPSRAPFLKSAADTN